MVCSLSPPPKRNKTKAGIAHFHVWVNNEKPQAWQQEAGAVSSQWSPLTSSLPSRKLRTASALSLQPLQRQGEVPHLRTF